jgi:hypothetical protein
MKLEFSQQMFEKFANTNFNEYPSMWAEVLHAVGQALRS